MLSRVAAHEKAGIAKASSVCHQTLRQSQMETDEKGPQNPGEGEEEQGQRESPRTHLAEDPMRKLQRCVRDPLRVSLSICWWRLPTSLLRLPAQRRVT